MVGARGFDFTMDAMWEEIKISILQKRTGVYASSGKDSDSGGGPKTEGLIFLKELIEAGKLKTIAVRAFIIFMAFFYGTTAIVQSVKLRRYIVMHEASLISK